MSPTDVFLFLFAKMNIAIDLDDTIICYKGNRWIFKNGITEFLPKLPAKLHLITARSEEIRKKTLETLSEIESKLAIKFESVTFTEYREKGRFAAELGCSHLIDDCIEYLADCKKNNVIGILYNTNRNGIELKSREEIFNYFQTLN